MIRVIIADDHQIFRRGVRQILSDSPTLEVAKEAGSHDELFAALAAEAFDVLILDLSMPGSSGLDTLSEVRLRYPKMRVIVLSMYPAEQYAVRGLRSGASGYLTKESAGEQLAEAIERVHSGQHYITPQVAELLTRELVLPQTGPRHGVLSDQEFKVFLLLAEGKSPKEAADKLDVSSKTVSTYRARVFEKMGFSSNADLIRYAIDHGLATVTVAGR